MAIQISARVTTVCGTKGADAKISNFRSVLRNLLLLTQYSTDYIILSAFSSHYLCKYNPCFRNEKILFFGLGRTYKEYFKGEYAYGVVHLVTTKSIQWQCCTATAAKSV